jgi:hypothetical protein
LANRVKALDVQVFDAIEARDLFGSLVGEDNLNHEAEVKDLLEICRHYQDGSCSEPLANIAVGQWRGRYRPILLALVLGVGH